VSTKAALALMHVAAASVLIPSLRSNSSAQPQSTRDPMRV
jgi:hypothetical protein